VKSAVFLVPWFYMVKTAENEEVRRQIDAGVWSHVSIGFRYADLVCDLCGRSYWSGEEGTCPHVVGRVYDGRECTATYGGDLRKVEAVEGSLVYLGCQRGAVMIKSAARLWLPEGEKEGRRAEGGMPTTDDRRLTADQPGEGGMGLGDKTKRRKDMEDRMRAGDGSPPVPPGNGEGPERQVEDAAGRGAESGAPSLHQEETARLRALAADGELYRGDLRAEIRRLAGIVGAEREAGFLMEALPQAPAARLKELLAEYHQRAEKLFPPAALGTPAAPPAAPPGDPRAPRAHVVL
jgi:hypothetical protein